MAVPLISGVGTTISQVDVTNLALRAGIRPIEFIGATLGGSYRLAARGTTAATQGAGGICFSFRWTSAALNCLVHSVKFNWVMTTAPTAGTADFGLYICRGFSASDTGGTALVPTGNNQKKRTSYPPSVLADARIAAGSALGAGTRTVDASPMFQRYNYQAAAQGNGPTDFSYLFDLANEHPLLFTSTGSGEGFEIQNISALGTSGVATFYVEVAWSEVPIANF